MATWRDGTSTVRSGAVFESVVAGYTDQEITDRQAADGAHIAAADPHGDRRLAAHLAGGRFVAHAVACDYSADSLSWWNRNGGQDLNDLILTPMYALDAMTLTNWAINVVTGIATGVYRIGVWTIDDQTNPFQYVLGQQWATRLTDLGTVDCATTGNPTPIATNVSIPAGTWFAVGGCPQVALATVKIGDYLSGGSSPLGSVGSPASITQSVLGLKATGVTGAFGTTFTPTVRSAFGNGVGFRRTA